MAMSDYREPNIARPISIQSEHSYDYPTPPGYTNSTSAIIFQDIKSYGDVVLPPTRQTKPVSKFDMYRRGRAAFSKGGRCSYKKWRYVFMTMFTCIALAALGIAIYDLYELRENRNNSGQVILGQSAGASPASLVNKVSDGNTSTPSSMPQSVALTLNKTFDELEKRLAVQNNRIAVLENKVDQLSKISNSTSGTPGQQNKNHSKATQATALSVLGTLVAWAAAMHCR